jgi:hypothetical protein
MLSQLYLDIAAMRADDLLREAERDRRAAEAFRILREHAPERKQQKLKSNWLSRWIPGRIRRAVAARG